ncbi:MAG: hypothetical protein N2V75_06795 [Methanophagales archaeon]|nr:hypothetical protein [Methanophagales archaeon]
MRRSLIIYIDENKEKQPFLISISEKIEKIIDQLRERQRSVESALGDLAKLAEEIASNRKDQYLIKKSSAFSGFSGVTELLKV